MQDIEHGLPFAQTERSRLLTAATRVRRDSRVLLAIVPRTTDAYGLAGSANAGGRRQHGHGR